MKHTHVLAGIALAAASLASHADSGGGPLDLSTGSTFFGRTPTGPTFSDTFTFSIAESSLATGSITSSAIGPQDVDFTSIMLMSGAITLATFTNLGTDAQEFFALSPTLLAPGNYSLMVVGTQTPGAASYAGNLAVMPAPVPEPQTYALVLAGLTAMVFITRRRRQG
jgi:hypothetical protein